MFLQTGVQAAYSFIIGQKKEHTLSKTQAKDAKFESLSRHLCRAGLHIPGTPYFDRVAIPRARDAFPEI